MPIEVGMKRLQRALRYHKLLLVAFGAEVLLVLMLWRRGTTALTAMVVTLAAGLIAWNARATRRLLGAELGGSKLAQGAFIWLVPVIGAAFIEDLIGSGPWSGGPEDVDYGSLDGASGPVLWTDDRVGEDGPDVCERD
jgi:hypothetical protein